jgi:23S rRNA (cytosine1962-C5)-methyltransferase
MLIITIKQGKEKSLLERQPWIYASAVERVDGKGQSRAGTTAVVQSSKGVFLARAAYNARSQIRGRVWSFAADEPVDHAMIKRRVQAAIAAQAEKGFAGNPVHLIDGEKAGLSGLVVDWFGGRSGTLVCQFHAAGVDFWKVPIVQALIAGTGCPNVYERADAGMRKGEGLAVNEGPLAGDEPPDTIPFAEKGVRYALDIRTGVKTKIHSTGR